MTQQIATFLMFQDGKAEEAMTFYVSLFDDAKVVDVGHYGPDEAGAEGSVRHAAFRLAGRDYMCIDSPVQHGFGFTPSISLYVTVDSEAEFDRLWAALHEGGETLMAPGDHGFSTKFGWLNDRYGVSWQLNLP
ncbi:VOC family protein [Nonomuraea sp. NN258]|uniref:VOC family protein n=1 Tax=Nonomuraea antri TaxID=2730852 RepID=UPI0015699965|nr:VOC family protein [Nonomuraea antri]NRQ35487.1 VOC family protein [Nonomuraea antri]